MFAARIHFAPLIGFVGDQLPEIGRRACKHRSAQFGKLALSFEDRRELH